MKRIKKICSILITLVALISLSITCVYSQVPEGFSYQAIARDASGNLITDVVLDVRIAILTDETSPTVLWEEEHQVTSNAYGLFTIRIGMDGIRTGGTMASFADIDWGAQVLAIRTSIREDGGSWQEMDPSGLLSVPYSLLAKDVISKQQLSKTGNTLALSDGGQVDLSEYTDSLAVVSTDDASSEALFEVRRNDGQPVFSVYPNGVKVFVDDVGTKGPKGGFAIGGFDKAKGTNQDFMIISPDSIRMFMPNNPTVKGAGSKGGFAIGGFDASKGVEELYFNVSGKSVADTFASAPRILWYPLKEAFLAGRVHIGSPDSVGQNSTALGYHSIAMGSYSQAFGNSSMALSDNTTAIGYRAVASGIDSYAFGSGAEATGERSFSFGSVGLDDDGNPTGTPTLASGHYSVAFGMGAQALAKGAMAFGVGSSSGGYSSNSMGYYSTADGDYSIAIGYRSSASNRLGSAMGPLANAEGRYSLSLGYSSDATQDYSVAIGFNAQSINIYSTAIGYYTNASNEYSTAIGYRAKASGIDSYSFGSQSEALGEKSFAIGTVGLNPDGTPNAIPTKALGRYSLAMGMGTQSLNLGSIAMGVNSLADNDYAVAIGNTASASGAYSTSLGYRTSANGNKSISIGAYYNYTYYRFVYNPLTGRFEVTPVLVTKENIAEGDYSISFGNGNYSNAGGLALGTHNYARAIGSVAIGHTNYADSAYSFAAGYYNYARARGSFAMGDHITANSLHSFAVGRYNLDNGNQIEWVETDPLFMVGNGASSGTRANAFVVYKNGNAFIDGDLTVSGNISASVTGDGMGTHTATQNIRMNGYWLSGDGGSEGVFVNTSGLVGINTASPVYSLDVNGYARFRSDLYTNGRLEVTAATDASGIAGTGAVEIANSLRLDGNEIITNDNTALYLQNDNNGDLQVDGGSLFVDASTNRVGVGTSTPSYTLDVSGATRATGNIYGGAYITGSWEMDNYLDKTLGNVFTLSYSNTGVLGIVNDGRIISPAVYNTAVGATRRSVYVDSNGLLGYASSSIKYKTNIMPLENISWIYKLKPVTYNYKEDPDKRRQYGLIAEEVEKVNPLFVSYDDEGKPETVLYDDLIAPLLKAVQEQGRISDDQMLKMEMIVNENNQLRSENEDMKARLEQLELMIGSIMEKQ